MENMNYTTKLKQEGMEVTTSVRINAEMNVDISKTTPAEITLDIAGEGELVHISEYHFETTERHLDELTKQLELEMKKDIEQAIDDMKKINVEPWFLGQRIWVEDREYYNSLHWEDAGWREAAVKINVAVEMEQTGQKSMLDKKKIGD
ncbi:Spore germination B3/ GerAC like, C-terminal [Evansella caseinilytica]|uniref:Spore germination B3/ GerAC like, C-terminal n=1 Tax=Evansella caseinilytica TaxID=1503961 RepID=A0A1H3U7B9_9BACI|nr:Spore germination B3/ GerAC like, C-terminal [Evansella caseinilytica]